MVFNVKLVVDSDFFEDVWVSFFFSSFIVDDCKKEEKLERSGVVFFWKRKVRFAVLGF